MYHEHVHQYDFSNYIMERSTFRVSKLYMSTNEYLKIFMTLTSLIANNAYYIRI